MDVNTLIITILSGGLATTIATQILKSSAIAVEFQKYPRLTAGVISVIATLVAFQSQHFDFTTVLHSPGLAATIAGGIWLISASTYNHIIKR